VGAVNHGRQGLESSTSAGRALKRREAIMNGRGLATLVYKVPAPHSRDLKRWAFYVEDQESI
jgi:hypothetical protein